MEKWQNIELKGDALWTCIKLCMILWEMTITVPKNVKFTQFSHFSLKRTQIWVGFGAFLALFWINKMWVGMKTHRILVGTTFLTISACTVGKRTPKQPEKGAKMDKIQFLAIFSANLRALTEFLAYKWSLELARPKFKIWKKFEDTFFGKWTKRPKRVLTPVAHCAKKIPECNSASGRPSNTGSKLVLNIGLGQKTPKLWGPKVSDFKKWPKWPKKKFLVPMSWAPKISPKLVSMVMGQWYKRVKNDFFNFFHHHIFLSGL